MRRLLACLALAALVAACSERLDTPADCPTLCPGGQVEVLDTVLTPDPNLDSTFVGYTGRGLGLSFVATTTDSDLPEAYGVMRFFQRPDSVLINDTTYAYTTDSVSVSLTLASRDTAAHNLRVLLYRVPDPLTLDTSVTFTRITDALIEENLVDSLPVPDSAFVSLLRLTYSGADLDRLAIPPADSGVLGLAVAVRADGPTGTRFPSVGTSGPTFVTYVTAAIADTALRAQQLFRSPVLATWVQSPDTLPDPDLLSAGGTPSARAMIRFTLPDLIKDSASVSRAELELDLVHPIAWVPGDSVTLEVRPVLVDLSAKSPTAPAGRSTLRIADGTSGTLTLDVSAQVRGWLGANGFPAAFFVYVVPEASSMVLATFGSTRLGTAPRLRLVYSLPYDFGSR